MKLKTDKIFIEIKIQGLKLKQPKNKKTIMNFLGEKREKNDY